MTVYKLIQELIKYSPDANVVIVPEKRGGHNEKDEQPVGYISNRGMSPYRITGENTANPVVRINGNKPEEKSKT